MCRYATYYKQHFVCLGCRSSFKQDNLTHRAHPCPRCGEPMTVVGQDFAVPRRRDTSAWRALEAVLRAGLAFQSCGCGGPGFRPRTSAEVRARRAAARRFGLTEAVALARHDPWE